MLTFVLWQNLNIWCMDSEHQPVVRGLRSKHSLGLSKKKPQERHGECWRFYAACTSNGHLRKVVQCPQSISTHGHCISYLLLYNWPENLWMKIDIICYKFVGVSVTLGLADLSMAFSCVHSLLTDQLGTGSSKLASAKMTRLFPLCFSDASRRVA